MTVNSVTASDVQRFIFIILPGAATGCVHSGFILRQAAWFQKRSSRKTDRRPLRRQEIAGTAGWIVEHSLPATLSGVTSERSLRSVATFLIFELMIAYATFERDINCCRTRGAQILELA